MITIFLRGGLGNQMFQYARAVHLAKKYSTSLVVDTVYLQDRTPLRNITYRGYDLDIFMIEPEFSTLSRIARTIPIPLVWLGVDVVISAVQDFMGIKKWVSERSERFGSGVSPLSGNIFLAGFWQSEKYFKESTDEIRKAFQFKIPLSGEAMQLGEKIKTTNSVSLHVRRGDYATDKKVIKDMGETNLSYYQHATTTIAQQVDNPEFFVFSDDIDWCREHLSLPFPVTYVSASSAGPKASHHLQLMSLCKHNIITNSTFSWWGAWLNNNPQKIVIAPKRWYADGRGGEEDIIPQEWIKM